MTANTSLKKIKSNLILMFLSFEIFLVITMAFTFFTFSKLQGDASHINLIGGQRERILNIKFNLLSHFTASENKYLNLANEDIVLFDSILNRLVEKDITTQSKTIVNIKPLKNKKIIQQINETIEKWKIFKFVKIKANKHHDKLLILKEQLDEKMVDVITINKTFSDSLLKAQNEVYFIYDPVIQKIREKIIRLRVFLINYTFDMVEDMKREDLLNIEVISGQIQQRIEGIESGSEKYNIPPLSDINAPSLILLKDLKKEFKQYLIYVNKTIAERDGLILYMEKINSLSVDVIEELHKTANLLQKYSESKISTKKNIDSILLVLGLLILPGFLVLINKIFRDRLQAEKNLNEAMESLENSEQRFRLFVETATDAIISINSNGNIIFWNNAAEAIFGYSEEEVVGKDVTILIPDQYKSSHIAGIKRLSEGSISKIIGKRLELYGIRKNGKDFPIEFSVASLKTKEGIFFTSFIRDLTKSKETEALLKLRQTQLTKAEKMATLGILSTGIAHEINNPNNFIMLNTDILAGFWSDIIPVLEEYYKNNNDFTLGGLPFEDMQEEINQIIPGIAEGSRRIKKIVKALKEYVVASNSDMQGSININSVIESAALLVDNLIKESVINFNLKFGNDIPNIKGNFQTLEHTFINLLTNSCHALQKVKDDTNGNELTVTTSLSDDLQFVIIVFKDDGDGIASDDLPHAMDPFFTTKRDIGGTGLGLSLAQSIIKNHEGEIKISSNLEEGTEVTIRLPVNSKP